MTTTDTMTSTQARTAELSRAVDNARLLGIGRRLLDWARDTGGWETPVWAELRAVVEDRIADDRNVDAVLNLIEAAALVIGKAQWEGGVGDEGERASVRTHDLVLLEAALNAVTGRRSASPDGYPHAGSEVSLHGFCEVGYCPCQDRRRIPQPPLLEDAA